MFRLLFMRRVRHPTSWTRCWFDFVVCCGRIDFANAVETFDAGDGNFCASESFEAEHGADSGFDRTTVLFDDNVEIF